MDQNHSSLHQHTTMNLEERLKKIGLILREDSLVLFLVLGDPGLRWMSRTTTHGR